MYFLQAAQTGPPLIENPLQTGYPCTNCGQHDTAYVKTNNGEDIWSCSTKGIGGNCVDCNVCNKEPEMMGRLNHVCPQNPVILLYCTVAFVVSSIF
jgi:ssDNA-binding Zn-finger/Zn-ribbon topoisomerase 1